MQRNTNNKAVMIAPAMKSDVPNFLNKYVEGIEPEDATDFANRVIQGQYDDCMTVENALKQYLDERETASFVYKPEADID